MTGLEKEKKLQELLLEMTEGPPRSQDEFGEAWDELLGFSDEKQLEAQCVAQFLARFKGSLGTSELPCGACGSTEGVRLEPSRTAYPWDGRGQNPNAPLHLCRDCAADHHAHWDEMWDAYYSSRL